MFNGCSGNCTVVSPTKTNETSAEGRPGGRPSHASAPSYGEVMTGQLFPLPGFGSVHTIRPSIEGLMGVFAVM